MPGDNRTAIDGTLCGHAVVRFGGVPGCALERLVPAIVSLPDTCGLGPRAPQSLSPQARCHTSVVRTLVRNNRYNRWPRLDRRVAPLGSPVSALRLQDQTLPSGGNSRSGHQALDFDQALGERRLPKKSGRLRVSEDGPNWIDSAVSGVRKAISVPFASLNSRAGPWLRSPPRPEQPEGWRRRAASHSCPPRASPPRAFCHAAGRLRP